MRKRQTNPAGVTRGNPELEIMPGDAGGALQYFNATATVFPRSVFEQELGHKNGGGGGSRTRDLLFRREPLYPTELRHRLSRLDSRRAMTKKTYGHFRCGRTKKWRREGDSNPR